MFTGIIETLGEIVSVSTEGTNYIFKIKSAISKELKVDQSVSHDGVCLTVTDIDKKEGIHTVVAIDETLDKTSLQQWEKGYIVNLERAMPANGRFDGHIVQGHVDQIAVCKSIKNKNGSWDLHFTASHLNRGVIVPKGSICINGVSLTLVDAKINTTNLIFSVSIIPYTWENTNLQRLKAGDFVNIEFDVVGKYIAQMMKSQIS
ncbi:MAG: riboflavin synthase [Chitinophagaceae bacterium]|nr:MAG: riboflavin synthase [Chitinophagaceae bacterium]